MLQKCTCNRLVHFWQTFLIKVASITWCVCVQLFEKGRFHLFHEINQMTKIWTGQFSLVYNVGSFEKPFCSSLLPLYLRNFYINNHHILSRIYLTLSFHWCCMGNAVWVMTKSWHFVTSAGKKRSTVHFTIPVAHFSVVIFKPRIYSEPVSLKLVFGLLLHVMLPLPVRRSWEVTW